MSKIITEVVNGNTMCLLKNVMNVLHKHYPGHPFLVNIDDVGGVVNITHKMFSGVMGVTLHITKIDNDFKSVVRAGGEVLERFRVSRGRLKEDEIMNIHRKYTGEAVFDV